MGSRWMAGVLVLPLAVAGAVSSPARASMDPAPTWLIPPVDAAVGRRFEAPASEFGPGHRGVDYHVAPSTPVRAAGPGVVRFAGQVAATTAVTVDHGDGLQTTYSSLSEISVDTGEFVESGTWLGKSGLAHPAGASGLHFGVKLHGDYVDPLRYLGPIDVSDAIHLVADDRSECTSYRNLKARPPAPNDNVAIAVAGLGSRTEGAVEAEIYEHGPELLGYPSDRIYHFSYAGVGGPRLHRPYRRTETYRDLRSAAGRLRKMLIEIARKHPGASVDLIAHSQGGIVARTFLEKLVKTWDPRMPRVDHLVTFASPHAGVPLADNVETLGGTASGRLLLHALSAWARREGPVPDPISDALADLTPDSGLMRELAREDLTYGTRALALAAPTDLLVPADRALLPYETSRVVPGSGMVNAHAGIVRSPYALALAHAFLRDAPEPCPSAYDRWVPAATRALGWVESRLGSLYRAAVDASSALPGAGISWRLVEAGATRLWERP